jgi:Kef-type K+ transport system membrane component KefB
VFAIALGTWLPLEPLQGPVGKQVPLLLIIGISVAVTSIPVISRIFHDLGILQTRFARLVLGVAVLEDIFLWAVMAIATALAQSGALPMEGVARHLTATVGFMAFGLLLAPRLLRGLHAARWNRFAHSSPAAYLVLLLLAYTTVAAWLGVNQLFAAFLAGLAAPRGEPQAQGAISAISTVAHALFIPLYFTVVGYKLVFGSALSASLLLGFLAVACAIKLASVGLGARLAGFAPLGALNLAVATNARGGPGIAVASVAFDAGIISPSFYTTLVVVAVVTSQVAGTWLAAVLRRGLPLLGQEPAQPAVLLEASEEARAQVKKPA